MTLLGAIPEYLPGRSFCPVHPNGGDGCDGLCDVVIPTTECPVIGSPEERARTLMTEFDGEYANPDAVLYADWWWAWVEQSLEDQRRVLRRIVKDGRDLEDVEDLLHVDRTKITHCVAPLSNADRESSRMLYTAAVRLAAGSSIRSVARSLGVAPGRIQRLTALLSLRQPKEARGPEFDAQVIELRDGGASWGKIATELGVTRAVVQGIYNRRKGQS